MSRTRGMTPHIAALQDMGNPDAAPGSPPWARHVRAQLGAMINQEKSSVFAVRDYIKGMEKYQGYQALEREDGQPFASLQEFVTTRKPFGLGFDPMLHLLVMAETTERCGIQTLAELRARQDQALMAVVPPAPEKGKGRPRKDADEKCYNYNIKNRGTDKTYRTRKLKRDHPTIAAQLIQGHYKTLVEAEKAAGTHRTPKKKSTLPQDPQKLIALARQEYGDAYLAALRQALNEEAYSPAHMKAILLEDDVQRHLDAGAREDRP